MMLLEFVGVVTCGCVVIAAIDALSRWVVRRRTRLYDQARSDALRSWNASRSEGQ